MLANQFDCKNCTRPATPNVSALFCATCKVLGDISDATTVVSGHSAANVTARIPLPVPKSKTRAAGCAKTVLINVSVSPRGSKTSDVMEKRRPQNSRYPKMRETGLYVQRCAIISSYCANTVGVRVWDNSKVKRDGEMPIHAANNNRASRAA